MTQEQQNERNNIIRELAQWMNHDRLYAYTLNVYALQEGLITEEEANNVKGLLDQRWQEDIDTEKNKNKYMMAIFKKHGFSFTKVLWRLIEQFPTRSVGDPADATFHPNNDKIIKDTGIPSVSYYEIINNIISAGYMSKEIKNKSLIYKINFPAIMAVVSETTD